MRKLVGLLCVVTATQLQAQGTLVVSPHKCDIARQDQIQRIVDSLWIPIAQELVNEGKLQGAGSAYHGWGDEWNVVLWYTAPNPQTFFDGFRELFGRLGQRHPTVLPQLMSWCSEHKDNIYVMGRSTTPAAAAAPARRP